MSSPSPAAGPPPASPREIVSSRQFSFARDALFAAFAEPTRLAQWWGPAGFTNAFRRFEFRPGGAWEFTMIAPDGSRFDNTCRFAAIEPPARIVFIHEEPVHRFQMTMTFAAVETGTRVVWRMEFDSVDEVNRIGAFVAAANEQNFDRLHAHLAATSSPTHP